MTTRNFRVNNGLEVGDIAITASTNAITGVDALVLSTTTAPTADGELSNKKYVDDQIAGISTTSILSGTTNVTCSGTAVVVTASGNAELTVNDGGVRVHGDLVVDGGTTTINTTTLSVQDNII